MLAEGLAKLRGDKINCDHIEDYKNAELDAEMGERGMWYQDKEPANAKRYLKLDWTDKDFHNSFKGKKIKAIVEEIHPSKAVIYSEEIGWMGTIHFSEIQVVVLSEKQESTLKSTQVEKNIATLRRSDPQSNHHS